MPAITRPHGALWFPALAILLPCAFIGLLGYKWLAVEREAAAHRSVESARAVTVQIRGDLVDHLRRAAPAVIRSLEHLASGPAPYAQASSWPAPISAAFLFDRAGSLLSPNGSARFEEIVESYRRVSAEPAWQHAFGRVQELELAGRFTEALAAARPLAEMREPGQRASALLTLSRLSVAARHFEEADRYASEVPLCCPAARDEYGMSFALYAAWQRAVIHSRTADRGATMAAIVREIRDLLDRGFLGQAGDATHLELLQTKVGARGDLVALRRDLDRTRAAWDAQTATARAVGLWLPRLDAPASETAPAIGSSGERDRMFLVVLSRASGDRRLALMVGRDALARWLETWPTAHAAFEVTLVANGAAPPRATLIAPLFAEAPGLDLVVQPRGLDPTSDRRRQALFVAAVVAALVLTLLVGYFSVRDVSREVRTGQLRSTFIAGVTHELKTPLASIRLLAETLRSGRARPESTNELLDTIVAESDRLSRLVDNVLSSSRIESGMRAYDPRLVSLGDVARSAVRRFDYVLQQEGFHLVERIDGARVLVRADAEALGQSVINLLGNAVKYSGTSREIEVSVGSDGVQAELRIADHGIGIAPREQARIFDSFYRTPDAAAQTTGAGLGLALVRHFADAHDGAVRVDSRPGEGSVFTLRLPIVHTADDEHGADPHR